ncbi:MAG: tRNA uridine-5-carboxymethylaminomethyl(34) synthesis GTPase MnmE [Pseudomonadota bacterium]
MVKTIFALSSAPGRAAIALVRVSGPSAHDAAAALGADCLTPRRAVLRRLSDPETGLPIDDALVLRFDTPSSATGEHMVEFHVHGGRAVVNALLDALGRQADCRPAEAGEFTQRAFTNGKLDLTAAEGLADLIDAETAMQRVQALQQYDGALSRTYEDWRAALLEAMALVEASIDFSDESDVAESAVAQAGARIEELAGQIDRHLAAANQGEIVRDGYRVVLAGVPNAGKSSLLNALAARDVAIVSPEAGTTRDLIEVKLDLGGFPVVVTDTAGLRSDGGDVEREGIRRARARMTEANLIIWLIDPFNPVSPNGHTVESEQTQLENRETSPETITILNKVDGIPDHKSNLPNFDFAISARTGVGLTELTERIVSQARAALDSASSGAPPTAPRHRAHLSAARAHMQTFLSEDKALTELRAEDLRLAATELGRLTGRIDAEEILGGIFGRFCIGK